MLFMHAQILTGGQGVWVPPGKLQVIWVSIGNKQFVLPLKNVGPPPPGTLENNSIHLK